MRALSLLFPHGRSALFFFCDCDSCLCAVSVREEDLPWCPMRLEATGACDLAANSRDRGFLVCFNAHVVVMIVCFSHHVVCCGLQIG